MKDLHKTSCSQTSTESKETSGSPFASKKKKKEITVPKSFRNDLVKSCRWLKPQAQSNLDSLYCGLRATKSPVGRSTKQ